VNRDLKRPPQLRGRRRGGKSSRKIVDSPKRMTFTRTQKISETRINESKLKDYERGGKKKAT